MFNMIWQFSRKVKSLFSPKSSNMGEVQNFQNPELYKIKIENLLYASKILKIPS